MFKSAKEFSRLYPGGARKPYKIQKITFTFNAEEIEAFELKLYPNQIYELSISKVTYRSRRYHGM